LSWYVFPSKYDPKFKKNIYQISGRMNFKMNDVGGFFGGGGELSTEMEDDLSSHCPSYKVQAMGHFNDNRIEYEFSYHK
jgi:hypothetical protein